MNLQFIPDTKQKLDLICIYSLNVAFACLRMLEE